MTWRCCAGVWGLGWGGGELRGGRLVCKVVCVRQYVLAVRPSQVRQALKAGCVGGAKSKSSISNYINYSTL